MSYSIAGIDGHKKKLAVVVADVEVGGDYQFERCWYGSHAEQLRALAEWLIEQQVEGGNGIYRPILEIGMGCAGAVLEADLPEAEDACPKSGTLLLAQALSNRGRRSRKKDFLDAERLIDGRTHRTNQTATS